jgi:hypothetical protein
VVIPEIMGFQGHMDHKDQWALRVHPDLEGPQASLDHQEHKEYMVPKETMD